MHKLTASQPEPVTQRIYGSRPVHPLDGASNQPEVLPNTKSYGSKKRPTIRVKLKGSDREVIVNQSDFDPANHIRVE